MKKIKSSLFLLFLFAASLAFIGGDCGTNTTEPPPVFVEPPSNVDLIVDANPGGNSFALVSWEASTDEGQTDFKGYRIITYVLNSSNVIASTLSNSLIPKNSHTATINSIGRGTKYISYLFSELEDGTRSDSVATKIYGGIFYNDDGVIDEFSQSSTESGYGWNSNAGIGTQYSFTQTNAPAIDMHLRVQGGILKFFSPIKFLQGGKNTLFSDIGTGQDAFGKTDLDEPEFDEITVVDDHVYLLKTQENNYIKIWISRIDVVNGLNKVYFEYKVQPIINLRVLKR